MAILAVGIIGSLAPSSAQAQFFNWSWGNDGGEWDDRGDYGSFGPGQVYHSIGEQGFRVVAPLRRNGAVFVAEVIDRRGRRERLIVSAANGQILQRFVSTDPRAPRGAGYRQGDDLERQMGRADPGDMDPPVPPEAIPGVGQQRRAYNTPDDGGFGADPVVPRTAPRVLRAPRPKLVDRNPEPVEPDTQPTRIRPRPSEPMRLPSAPPSTAMRSSEPPVTQTRPAEPVVKPAGPDAATANAAPTSRMRDPLAIPRNEPKAAGAPSASISARRIQPGTVSGAPGADAPPPKAEPTKPIPPASAKAVDVPAAPLD